MTGLLLHQVCSFACNIDAFAALTQEYKTDSDRTGAGPAFFTLSFEDFMADPLSYQQEVFGPSTIIVKCSSVDQFLKVPDVLGILLFPPSYSCAEGQLTASFHAVKADCEKASQVGSMILPDPC